MRRLAVTIAVVILVVAGCGDDDGGPGGLSDEIAGQIADEADGVTDIDVGSDGEEFSVTFEDEEGAGVAALGGDLPDDFPFPVPDGYEVGSSMQFEDTSGKTFSAVIRVGDDEFDAAAGLYETFLTDEGFEVERQAIEGDAGRFLFLSASRADVNADVSMSIEEVANGVFETLISLTWAPAG